MLGGVLSREQTRSQSSVLAKLGKRIDDILVSLAEPQFARCVVGHGSPTSLIPAGIFAAVVTSAPVGWSVRRAQRNQAGSQRGRKGRGRNAGRGARPTWYLRMADFSCNEWTYR